MKRLTNLFTLLIFLGSNFLVPLTYAEDLSDEGISGTTEKILIEKLVDEWLQKDVGWEIILVEDADSLLVDSEDLEEDKAKEKVNNESEEEMLSEIEDLEESESEKTLEVEEFNHDNADISSILEKWNEMWVLSETIDEEVDCYYSVNEDGSLWFNVSDWWLFASWARCKDSLVEIPNWVKKIWDRSAWMFPGVTSIILPDSVEEIGTWWLAVSTLENVVLGEWVKIIWNNAFQWTKIASIDLKNVENIWEFAFTQVSTLNEVKMTSARKIWKQAFFYTSIAEVNLPSVEFIWKQAFAFVDWLKTVNISWVEQWAIIWAQAFEESPKFEIEWSKFVFGDDIIYIWSDMFQNSKVEEIIIEWTSSDGWYNCLEYDSRWEEYEISSDRKICVDWDVWHWTRIWDVAFQWATWLKKVTLWEWVTHLWYSAFVWSSVKEAVIEGNDKYGTDIWHNAFSATPLERVTLWTWITTLWEYSFMNTKIESINIPWTVKSIETAAFHWVKSLKSVAFGYWLEKIWNSAFIGTSLESIDILWSDTWTVIEHEAFLWITWVTHLTISWVREIQPWAFQRVWQANWIDNIVEISWTDKYDTIIASWAFFDSWLRKLKIWEDVTFIWRDCFAGSKLLDSVNVIWSDKWVYVWEQAFRAAWQSITWDDVSVSYKFWENVIYLWNNMFQDSWVKNLVISWNNSNLINKIGRYDYRYNEQTGKRSWTYGIDDVTWTYIGVTAFQNTKQLEYVHLWEWVTSIGYSAFGGSNVKEAVIDGNEKYWTVIDHNAFQGTPLEKVTLWTWITDLWTYSFSNTKLESIFIPGTVKSLETAAFNGVKTLKSVTFGYWLERIWNSAFVWTSLESIDIAWSDTWTVIEHEAFLNTTWLTHLTINWVKEIQSHAFQWVWTDKWINQLVINGIDDGTIIQKWAFRKSWVKSLILWTWVTVVWEQSFEDVDKLETLVILWSEKWTKIWNQAFLDSNNIKTVELGSGVDYIWWQAFHKLDSIEKIIIKWSDRWTVIGQEAFQTNKSISTELILWEWVRAISWAAFRTLKIENVSIPNSVEYIWEHAFLHSKVKNLSLWSWIKYIWKEAFASDIYMDLVPFLANPMDVTVGVNAFSYNLEQPVKLLTEYDVSQVSEEKKQEYYSWGAVLLQWYRITYMNEWKEIWYDIYASWYEIKLPKNPEKYLYIFQWWDWLSEFENQWKFFMPPHNLTVFAKWRISPSAVSWWGWKSTQKSEVKEQDSSKEEYTEVKTAITTENVADKIPSTHGVAVKEYSEEFQQAYKFAHENWITTKDTIQTAQMNGKLTRIAMAKMLSQYAINVMWKEPDISKWVVKFNDVTSKKDADYDNWVTLAYQLWIMWQNMPWNNFRPNDEVTRAEFATALSRMAYWTLDGEYEATSKYYIHHMEKLVKEWVITKDDPNMKELRGYVMIMLMRSAK